MNRLWIDVAVMFPLIFLLNLDHSSAQSSPSLIGTFSCTTSTCHGANPSIPGPAWTTAASVHFARDPHASAAEVLYGDLSRAIVHRLDSTTKLLPEAYDNLLRSRCMSCHGTIDESQTKPIGLISLELIGVGVSCEACHGPASQWIDAHRNRDWTDDDGFRPLKTTQQRADSCCRCHIGSRRDDHLIRDMNHDLIAAGHPALRFDYQTYMENLPKHWDDGEADNEPSMKIHHVGRTRSLRSAAALAGQRATDHMTIDRSIPWPELADYDCFACHQSLRQDAYLLPTKTPKRGGLPVSDGLPIWNWYYTIDVLSPVTADVASRLQINQRDPQVMARGANEILEKLDEQSIRFQAEEFQPSEQIETMLTQQMDSPVTQWNEAAVAALQLRSVLQDVWPLETLPSSWNDRLQSLMGLLKFEEAPLQTDAPISQSPRRFDRKQFDGVYTPLLRELSTFIQSGQP